MKSREEIIKRCEVCGKRFNYIYCTKKYCSQKCKKRKEYLNSLQRNLTYQRNYRLKHLKEASSYMNEYKKQRSKIDLNFKIKGLLITSLYNSLRLYTSKGKTYSSSKYGIDYDKIVKHLIETKPKDFNEKKYHIDHIYPLSKFNLQDIKQIKIAFAPDNLQWLEAKENIIKSNKIYPRPEIIKSF